MQCEIQSMSEKGRSNDEGKDDPIPPEGFVQQVCQGWLVHEDSALAHKLQKEEIEMHYGKNRNERKVVREDLKCARNMQDEENEEATSIQRMYEEMLLEQEKIDEEIAVQLQRKEQSEIEKLRHFKEADEELARQLQEKEKHKYEKKKREKGILKEIKQVEKVRAQCVTDQGIPSEEIHSCPSANDISTQIFAGEYNGFDDLSDFCIKPTPEMDDTSVRKLQEEQDAELARLLQEQETKRSGYSDRDRLMAIEAQDRELARVLQEQERARAKRAKEKARQKALKKQSEQFVSEDGSQSPVTYSSLESCSNLPSSSEEKITKSPMLNTPTSSLKRSGIARPTQLDITSTIYSGISEHNDSRQNTTLPSGISSGQSGSGGISNDARQQKPDIAVLNHNVNIAMAIDPTYGRKQHSSALDLVPNENNGSNGSTPILPSPISIRTGTYNGDDHYYDSDEGPAPPYMPIQGQRRNSSLEKKKKGKEGCKQQ